MNTFSEKSRLAVFLLLIFLLVGLTNNCTSADRTVRKSFTTTDTIIGTWLLDKPLLQRPSDLHNFNQKLLSEKVIFQDLFDSYEVAIQSPDLLKILYEIEPQLEITKNQFVMTDSKTGQVLRSFTYDRMERTERGTLFLRNDQDSVPLIVVNEDYILLLSASSCGVLHFPYYRIKK